MALTKIAERKLDVVPRGLHMAESKIYVITKKRFTIVTDYALARIQKIEHEFPGIRILVGDEENLVCVSDTGAVYRMDPETLDKEWVDDSVYSISTALHDASTGLTMLGRQDGALVVLSRKLELQKKLYGPSGKIIEIAMSELGTVACISEIDMNVTFLDLKSSECKSMKIPRGYPQTVVFVDGVRIVVGNELGDLYLIDSMKKSVLHVLELGSSIFSLLSRDGHLVVGTEDGRVCLGQVVNSAIEIADCHQCNGMINGLCLRNGHLAVTVGREPKFGRWTTRKDGENKVAVFKIE